MPRTISAAQQTQLAKNITTPVYLIDLLFDIPLYYSSNQEVVYDSNTYVENRVVKIRLNDNKGIITGTIHISNIDLNIGALALSQTLQGKSCNIYTITTTAGTAIAADTTLLLEGIVYGVSSISEREVILDINSINANIAYSPRIYCAPPLFSHAIPAGTIINWNDTPYELVGAP